MASAAPSPSPSLSAVVAAPASSDYVDDTTSPIPILGDFDLHAYVDYIDPPNPTSTQQALQRDGFVAGFSRSWLSRSTSHILLEVVVAFAGGEGAHRWLDTFGSLAKAEQHYAHTLTVQGIDPYRAWHGADAGAPEYADFVAFVKGNDFFVVVVDSRAEDLGDAAPAQSRALFGSAPAFTIPPGQWPENTGSAPRYAIALLAGGAVLVLLILATAAAVTARAIRRPT